MIEATREGGHKVDDAAVSVVEVQLNAVFPDAYKHFLLTYNGGRPTPSHFSILRNGQVEWMRVFFFFGIDHPIRSCDLFWNFIALRRRVPDRVLPIASDEFGNVFCLDQRTQRNGPIRIWDHEEERHGAELSVRLVVAPNFAEWIEGFVHAT
jgi:hypothetical protein